MPTRTYRYLHLDVFTEQRFGGNQLAVFPVAEGLDDATMQRIAREIGFSETTFVVAPGDPAADRRVRIFTPTTELPLAGHPIVGTAIALAHEGVIAPPAGGAGAVVARFQLGVGTLPVDVTFAGGQGQFAWMHQPIPQFAPWSGDPAALATALGLSAGELGSAALPLERGSAGVPFVFVAVPTRAALGQMGPGAELAAVLAASDCHGAYAFTEETGDAAVTAQVRVFPVVIGIKEDAATGAAAGPFGAYLRRHGRITPAADGVASARLAQGLEMGRPSQIQVRVTGAPDAFSDVAVGGRAVLVATGELLVDMA
ncbi:MAG TPA: PhzF family phenazine biosynthesis protein [Ktedonobacterales bacterium]|nr:PhzF family phenazine biosynthesis protein [Ktedonobacterales bacterium]